MHQKVETVIRKILTVVEVILAVLTLVVMVGNLAIAAYNIIFTGTIPGTEAFLHNILAVAVGLEFVRMLVDMTPANTIEVLIVALSRQVILSHDNALSNLACVACIAGLFATRRYLIRRKEMKIEMSEVE